MPTVPKENLAEADKCERMARMLFGTWNYNECLTRQDRIWFGRRIMRLNYKAMLLRQTARRRV